MKKSLLFAKAKMSRIGKMPIKIPEGVTLKIEKEMFVATGPKGEVRQTIPSAAIIEIKEGEILCNCKDNSLWGLTRSLVANAVLGVSVGWGKTLELSGVGFRAEVVNGELVLNLGFSHQVKIKAPVGISFKVNENKIEIFGSDKQAVGELAAAIRRVKPPEPYKGKGIKYLGEKIRRKLGKAAKAIGGAGTAGGAK